MPARWSLRVLGPIRAYGPSAESLSPLRAADPQLRRLFPRARPPAIGGNGSAAGSGSDDGGTRRPRDPGIVGHSVGPNGTLRQINRLDSVS